MFMDQDGGPGEAKTISKLMGDNRQFIITYHNKFVTTIEYS